MSALWRLKMHLHWEKSSNTAGDCCIRSLSWMGRVPDEIPQVRCRLLSVFTVRRPKASRSTDHFSSRNREGSNAFSAIQLMSTGRGAFSHRDPRIAHSHREGSIQPPRSQIRSFAQGGEHSAAEIPKLLICTGRGAFSHRAHKPLAMDLTGKGT